MITEEIDGFEITLTAEDENTHPLDHVEGESDTDKDEYMTKFINGELMWFCAKVTASKYDIALGEGYLGCCAYESLQDFKDSSDYYEGMRVEALTEAKRKIAEIMKGEQDEQRI